MKDSQGHCEKATPVQGEAIHNDKEKPRNEGPTASTGSSRRSFLGTVGGGAAAAGASGAGAVEGAGDAVGGGAGLSTCQLAAASSISAIMRAMTV